MQIGRRIVQLLGMTTPDITAGHMALNKNLFPKQDQTQTLFIGIEACFPSLACHMVTPVTI